MSLRAVLKSVSVDHFAFLVHSEKYALAQELLAEFGWQELTGNAKKGDGWEAHFWQPNEGEVLIQLTLEDNYSGSRVECLPGVHLGVSVWHEDAVDAAVAIKHWAIDHGLHPAVEAANELKTKMFVSIPDLWTIDLEIVAYGLPED